MVLEQHDRCISLDPVLTVVVQPFEYLGFVMSVDMAFQVTHDVLQDVDMMAAAGRIAMVCMNSEK